MRGTGSPWRPNPGGSAPRPHPRSPSRGAGEDGGASGECLGAWASVALAGAGVAVSGYLVWVHYGGALALCTGAGGCAQVQASRFASVAGVPVALLGLGLYVALLALGVWWLRGAGRWMPLVGFGRFTLALAGTLYSAYLTYLELFVIGAVCPWCVVSAGLVTALCALAARDVLASAEEAARADP